MAKRLTLLATGGTIASVPSGDGLRPALRARELLSLCPIANCEPLDVFQLDSSNIQPEEWQTLASAIRRALSRSDACIVTHGTDTMAYTAAALSFMLLDIDKPVILTGSQLPLEHALTDARTNLLEAAEAAYTAPAGVYLCFHHKIIAGTRAVKMRTTSFDAFDSVNAPLCGTLDTAGVHWLHVPQRASLPSGAYAGGIDPNVFLLKLIPGTAPELLTRLPDSRYKGLVVEAFGLGGLHYIRRNLIDVLHALSSKGILTLVTTQCMYEKADFSIYEVGRGILGENIFSGRDMTSEAAVAKLMWVLGNPTLRTPLLTQPLCGEMTL